MARVRKPRVVRIPEHLVALPATCTHGKPFKAFLSAPPGTVVYDPGCKHKSKIHDMLAHYVGPEGLITKNEWNKLYESR